MVEGQGRDGRTASGQGAENKGGKERSPVKKRLFRSTFVTKAQRIRKKRARGKDEVSRLYTFSSVGDR